MEGSPIPFSTNKPSLQTNASDVQLINGLPKINHISSYITDFTVTEETLHNRDGDHDGININNMIDEREDSVKSSDLFGSGDNDELNARAKQYLVGLAPFQSGNVNSNGNGNGNINDCNSNTNRFGNENHITPQQTPTAFITGGGNTAVTTGDGENVTLEMPDLQLNSTTLGGPTTLGGQTMGNNQNNSNNSNNTTNDELSSDNICLLYMYIFE